MGKAHRSLEKIQERKLKKNVRRKNKQKEIKTTVAEVKAHNMNLQDENKKIKEESKKMKDENLKAKDENLKVKDENEKIKIANKEMKEKNQTIMVNLMTVHEELKTLKKSVLDPYNQQLTSVSKDIIKRKHNSIAAKYNKLSNKVVEISDTIIGEGTFGRVQVGTMLKLGIKCAVKSGKTVHYFNADHEAAVLQRLQGSIYVPHLFGVLDGKLVMEYIVPEDDSPPVTVHRARVDGFFNQTMWSEICHHLIDAVVYLHSHSILHNDLKSNNVLIKSGFIPIIVDFGKATLRKNPEVYKLTTSQMERYNSRYPHLAYELRNKFGSKTSTATDIYSLGFMFKFVADQTNELLQRLQKRMLEEDVNKKIQSPDILRNFNHAKDRGYN